MEFSISEWITAVSTAITAAAVVATFRAQRRATRPTAELIAWESSERILGFVVCVRNRTPYGIRLMQLAIESPREGSLAVLDPPRANDPLDLVQQKMERVGLDPIIREKIEPGELISVRFHWHLPRPVDWYSEFRMSAVIWEMELKARPVALRLETSRGLIRSLKAAPISPSPVRERGPVQVRWGALVDRLVRGLRS